MFEAMQYKWFGSMFGVMLLAACNGSGSSAHDHKGDAGASDDTDGGKQAGDGGADSAEDGGAGDGDADGGDATVGGGPIFPDEPVTKQYWMRADMDVEMSSGVDSATMTFSAYSLVAVTRDKTGYEMIDLQCQVAANNGKCEDGSAFCTTIDAAVHEGQAYAPSQRTLSFAGNQWTSSACAQAVGWKWSCTDGPKGAALPTDESDPLVYNPGADDPADVLNGVDIKITFAGPSFPEPQWCITAAVQKVDVIYSGELMDGDLALTGTVKDNGSKQNLLNDYCGSFMTPVSQGPGRLRLVEKTFAGGSDASKWACPSLDAFQKAFAKK
jgi:hypothetical protein